MTDSREQPNAEDKVTQARRLILKGMPGTTLFTLGDRQRGTVLLVLSTLGPLSILLFGLFPVGILLWVVFCWICLSVFGALYEWVVVKKVAEQAEVVPTKTPTLAWVFVVLFLVACILFGMTFVPRNSIRRTVNSGMEPTIHVADSIIFTKLKSDAGIERGDVVTAWVAPEKIIAERAYWVPDEQGRFIVLARVVGVPGDLVSASKQGIKVNGKALSRGEDPVFVTSSGDEASRQWMLESGSFFLACDAPRSGSSASFGVIPREQILSRATTILWSNDLGRIGSAVE